jgi:uncharacterized protein with NRDE domain
MKNDTKSTWALTQGGTGYPKYWEFANSSIFVRNNVANFCTVSTTVLVIDQNGNAFFREQRYRHSNNFFTKLFSSCNCLRPKYEIETDVKENFTVN